MPLDTALPQLGVESGIQTASMTGKVKSAFKPGRGIFHRHRELLQWQSTKFDVKDVGSSRKAAE